MVADFQQQLSAAASTEPPGQQLAAAKQSYGVLSDQVKESLWNLEQDLCYALQKLYNLDNVLPLAVVLEVKQICEAVTVILPEKLTWALWKRLRLLCGFYSVQVAQQKSPPLETQRPKHQRPDWHWDNLSSVLDSELLSYVHNTCAGLRTNNLGSILDSFHNLLGLRMRETRRECRSCSCGALHGPQDIPVSPSWYCAKQLSADA